MSEYTPINDPDFEKMLLDAAVDMFQEKNRFPVPKAGNQGAGNQGSPAPPPSLGVVNKVALSTGTVVSTGNPE